MRTSFVASHRESGEISHVANSIMAVASPDLSSQYDISADFLADNGESHQSWIFAVRAAHYTEWSLTRGGQGLIIRRHSSGARRFRRYSRARK